MLFHPAPPPPDWSGQVDAQLAQDLQHNMELIVQGKQRMLELALATLVAGGHLLLHDRPGTGKTILAQALAISPGLTVQRHALYGNQTAEQVWDSRNFRPQMGSFSYQAAVGKSQVLLMEGLERASPGIQAALAECMEEHQVQRDGRSMELPTPFMVIATSSLPPHQPLPLEASLLDRFMVCLSPGWPDSVNEALLVQQQQFSHPINRLQAIAQPAQLIQLMQGACTVSISTGVATLINAIITATRRHEALAYGASPRATVALAKLARAVTYMRGRSEVTAEMVRELAVPVLVHRVGVASAHTQRTAADVLHEIITLQHSLR